MTPNTTETEERLRFVAKLRACTDSDGKIALTPALSREALGLCRNPHNRTIAPSKRDGYKKDMLNGHWVDNPMPIAFTVDGILNNGHHRLEALSELPETAKVTMRMAFNLSPEAFLVTDANTNNRKDRDVFAINQKRKGNNKVTDSRVSDPIIWVARINNTKNRAGKPSPWEINAIYDAFSPEINDIIDVCGDTKRGRTSAGIKAALMLRLYEYRSDTEKRSLLLEQWINFVRSSDKELLDQTTFAMRERLGSLSGEGSVNAIERGIIGWIGWNPNERQRKQIKVSNKDKHLDDMREVIRKALEAAASTSNVPATVC